MNPYEVLGVPRDATAEDITKAYRNLAKTWHPDKNQHRQHEADEKMKILNSAHEILRDPKLRRAYDEKGSSRHEDPEMFTQTSESGPDPNIDDMMAKWALHFEIKQEEVPELVKAWAESLWFAPGDLSSEIKFPSIKKVMVPVWIADYDLLVKSGGEVFSNHHTELLGFPPELKMSKFRDWDLDRLEAIDEETRAKSGPSHTQELRKRAVTDFQNNVAWNQRLWRLLLLIQTQTGDSTSMVNIKTARYKEQPVLLPLYDVEYEYENTHYSVVVNGQSGEVDGDRPYSTAKIAGASIISALFGAFVMQSNSNDK